MSLFRPQSENTDNHPFSNTGGPFNESTNQSTNESTQVQAAHQSTPSSFASPPSEFAPPSTMTPVPGSAAPLDAAVTQPQSPAPLVSSASVQEGTPYKASGRSGPGSTARLILTTLIVSIVVGVVYHFVARFLDLIVIFPLAAGAIAGSFIASTVENGKVRKPRLVLVCMVAAGLLVYGTKLFLNSRQYRSEMIAGITEAIESSQGAQKATPAQHAQMVSFIDSQLGIWPTFRLYMRAQSATGVSLKRHGIGEGISIAGPWYWGLLALEIGLCAAGAGAFTPSKAEDPFCEQADQWLEGETILRVHPTQNATLMEKLVARDWRGLLETPQGGAVDEKNNSDVILYSASGAPTATIAIKSTAKGTRPMAHVHVTQQTVETMRAICREIDERETAVEASDLTLQPAAAEA